MSRVPESSDSTHLSPKAGERWGTQVIEFLIMILCLGHTKVGHPAGNLHKQGPGGTHLYLYDGENRMTYAVGTTYTYDANGIRVRKQTDVNNFTEYIYFGSEVIAEKQVVAGGTPVWTDYIFGNGKRIAKAPGVIATSGTEYYHADHLGSARLMTNAQGTVIPGSEGTFLPYGQELAPTTTNNHYKFTGKERDSESGLDYFGARYYGSTMGRFATPDPEQETGFLYMGDPQAWNGYAYARNNPLNVVDPTGYSYEYCSQDEKGNYTRCHVVSDKQHDKDRKENTFKDGKILDGETQIGTYRQLDVDLPGDPEANRQAAAFIVNEFNTTMVEFGKNAAATATFSLALRGVGVLAEKGIELLARETLINRAMGSLTPKIVNQMGQRGWTPQDIERAIRYGQQNAATDRTAGFTAATRYTDPVTGKYIVVNNTTGKVIQVSRSDFYKTPR
jgi:RHS repeat-associated protein